MEPLIYNEMLLIITSSFDIFNIFIMFMTLFGKALIELAMEQAVNVVSIFILKKNMYHLFLLACIHDGTVN
jgi:hypothetical protein